jgi:hypothetical protein
VAHRPNWARGTTRGYRDYPALGLSEDPQLDVVAHVDADGWWVWRFTGLLLFLSFKFLWAVGSGRRRPAMCAAQRPPLFPLTGWGHGGDVPALHRRDQRGGCAGRLGLLLILWDFAAAFRSVFGFAALAS